MHENPVECQVIGENAKKEYDKKYTPEIKYKMLMNIYQSAIDGNK